MGELVVGEEGKLSQRRRIVQQTDSYGVVNHSSEHVQQSENIACWSIVLPEDLNANTINDKSKNPRYKSERHPTINQQNHL